MAAIQFEPTRFAKAENLAALLTLTEEAAAGGAKLIVTPELAATAYCWASREEVAAEVEPVPGPTTAQFGEIAARHTCWIVVGLAEVDPQTGIYYNSAVLIGPQGPVGLYRKTHAYISEPKWAKDGDLGLPVFETPLGRIAMTICMDAVYPETARVPALAGADVICFPTNWLSEKSPSPSWMARAAENGVYFIAANRYGLERGVQFSGGSAVIDPDGSVQSALDSGDGIVWGWVNPARARDKRPALPPKPRPLPVPPPVPPPAGGRSLPLQGGGVSTGGGSLPGCPEDLLADRRPDAYGAMTRNTYLWNPDEFHGLYDLRPLPEERRSRAAVVQFSPVAGDVKTNLDRIEHEVDGMPDVDLIVFPELAVCGPIADREAAERCATPIPGPVSARLHRIAAASGAYLVAGLVERDEGTGRLFNSAVLVGPEGVVGTYRNVHLAAADRAWATPGDRGLPTFDVPPGRVGMLIGYDALFPEAARSLAIDGADIIACPSLMAWPPVLPCGATAMPLASHVETGPTEDHFHLWRERERENNAHVLFANGAAPAMGWSGIFAASLETEPRREALVRGDGEGTALLEIDSAGVVRAKDLVGKRVPIWYDALQTPIEAAARVARERGARAEAWLAGAFSPLGSTGLGA